MSKVVAVVRRPANNTMMVSAVHSPSVGGNQWLCDSEDSRRSGMEMVLSYPDDEVPWHEHYRPPEWNVTTAIAWALLVDMMMWDVMFM